MKCWRCGGVGTYPIGIITGNGEWTTIIKTCPTCGGTGNNTSVLQDEAAEAVKAAMELEGER